MKVRVVKDHFCGTGWRAEPETLYLGGVGAVYVEKLEFELPEEWDGLAVTLHIEQEGGTMPQPMLLDGLEQVFCAHDLVAVLQSFIVQIGVHGAGNSQLAQIQVVIRLLLVLVAPAGDRHTFDTAFTQRFIFCAGDDFELPLQGLAIALFVRFIRQEAFGDHKSGLLFGRNGVFGQKCTQIHIKNPFLLKNHCIPSSRVKFSGISKSSKVKSISSSMYSASASNLARMPPSILQSFRMTV